MLDRDAISIGNFSDRDFNKLNIGDRPKVHKYAPCDAFNVISVCLGKFSGRVNSFIFAPASNDCLN